MGMEADDRVAGTIYLSALENSTLKPPRVKSRTIGPLEFSVELIYHLNGQDVNVGPVKTIFWTMAKKKELIFVNALIQWFLDHEIQVRRAVIDAEYDKLSDTIARAMQYTSGVDETYRRNFPEFEEPDFDIEDPACRSRIISKRELVENMYIDEIGLEYEDKRIAKATFYCANKLIEPAPERIQQMMAEIDGDYIECSYLVQWEGSR